MSKKLVPALIALIAAMSSFSCGTFSPRAFRSTAAIASSEASATSTALPWAAKSFERFQGAPVYFGFWGNALSWIGSGNYMAQNAPYSNLAFIDYDEDTTRKWAEKLAEARQLSQNVLLVVQNTAFPWSSTIPYPDFRERLTRMLENVSPYQDVIVGFYLFDEPFWHNTIDQTRTSDENLHATLNEISDLLRRQTGRITALMYAYPELRDQKPIVRNVDWIGFDCYLSDKGCPDSASVLGYFADLHLRKEPHQKILVVPDSSWLSAAPTPAQTQELSARVQLWKQLINESDQVIAITPFLYQSVPSEHIHGANDPALTAVLDDYRSVGAKTLANRGAGCVVKEPKCEGLDLVRRDSCGKELGRWEKAPPCTQSIGTVIGWIDGVTPLADGGARISGWACAPGMKGSIQVHIYSGAPAGSPGSQILTGDFANLPSEMAVQKTCGDALSPHRFATDLKSDTVSALHGKPIFVHAIDPLGRNNALIRGSGEHRIP